MRNLSWGGENGRIIVDGLGNRVALVGSWQDGDYLISLEKEVERLLARERELEFDLDTALADLEEYKNEKGQPAKTKPCEELPSQPGQLPEQEAARKEAKEQAQVQAYKATTRV